MQLEQTSYKLPDSDNIKENVAYGTALYELIQTEDNKAYIKTDHERIQFVENQSYGTADHKKLIQTKSNKAYEDTLITKQNEAYASVDHERSCQMMRKNQAYVSTDPERTHSSLPTATVGEDEQVSQSYEQISLNDDSAPPTQQQQQGNQCEGNDETYDYITQ
jgi:hypothetical protein